MIKESKFYAVIMNAGLATEEEDELLEILKPEGKSEEELGADFENVVGYNPITYCDREKAEKVLDFISQEYPEYASRISEIYDDVYYAVETAVRESKNQTIGETVMDTVLCLLSDLEIDIKALSENIARTLDLEPETLFDPDEDALDAERFLDEDEDENDTDSEEDEDECEADDADLYNEAGEFEEEDDE